MLRFIALLWLLGACNNPTPMGAPEPRPVSQDPADYPAAGAVDWQVSATEPRFVVPSTGLPDELDLMPSNNNVDIAFHDDRLFLAWRNAPTHFASEETRMVVVSSTDEGATWESETEVALGTDVREPRLVSFQGELQLIYFEAGSELFTFEPRRIWRTFRQGPGVWSEPEVMVDGPEVPWDIKVRDGRVWMTSYEGEHYGEPGSGAIDVYFKVSDDGRAWKSVDDATHVYRGGASEAAFEFTATGDLWAVTRNEDGDATGFGSHLCSATADSLSVWDCGDVSDPERYDSPEMFRHDDDIYLLARRDIGGPFGPEGSLTDYSLRPKTTALYLVDPTTRSVVHLQDLPGAGDNAFPAVQRTSEHRFLVANYTSPLEPPDLSWIDGQMSDLGTQIYLLDLVFSSGP